MRKFLKKAYKDINDLINFFFTTPKVVIFMFLVYFMQGILHNLGHPVTPQFVKDLGIGHEYFGYFFAAMSFGLLVGSPIWGYLGDRGNSKIYVFAGLLIYSLGQYLFGFSTNKNLMIIYRFMSGFGVSASITLIMSHLIKHSPMERRKIYLGWYQALFVLGASLGYYIGGKMAGTAFFVDLLHTNEFKNIFLVQAVLNIVHAIYIVLLMSIDSKKIYVENNNGTKPSFIKGIKAVSKLNTNLLIFLISLTFISLGAITVSKFIEVYMSDIGLIPEDIGRFVGLTGIVSLLATMIIVPVVARVNKDFPIMLMIQILSAVIIFIVFRQESIMIALYSGFLFYIVLKAVFSPLEQHYIASHSSSENLGTIMGVRQSFYSIGLVLGPLLGGWLYDVKPLYAFDFSAFMFVLGFVLILIVGRNIKRNNHTENLE